MPNNFGLSPLEIDELHHIDPETAAHNIALTYVNLTAKPDELFQGENTSTTDVLSISAQYVDAYNYAYNLVSNRNRIIDEAE